MTFSNFLQTTIPAKALLALLVAFSTSYVGGFAATASAQLTTEALIGSAVSLSNRDYPNVEKAIQRFNNQDAEGALEYLKLAKEKNPKLPPTFVTLAKMHMIVRNGQAAHNLLERAVTEEPNDPEAYLLLADQAFQGNRTTEAQALFEMAEPLVEQFSGNTKRKRNFEKRVIAGRAAVAERRGNWEKAHDLLKQWVEMDPENGLAQARLGVTLFRMDQPKEAFDAFTKARELNPDMPHPYVSLGKLFTQKEEIEKARKAFERAYAEDKSNVVTTREYAEWLMQQGELEKAQQVATSLREMAPDSAEAVLLQGVVAIMQGERERAEEAFSRVLSLDPGNARANDLLALMLIESDDPADQNRALRYAQINAERFENNSQANITKAYVLYKLGRSGEAQEALQIGARGQLQADSAFLIAKIMAEEGQKDKALQALEQVVNQKSGLFIFRRQAEQLLEELRQEAG